MLYPPPTGPVLMKFGSLIFALLFYSTGIIAQENLPKVHIIATGGTIASGGARQLTGEDLVKVIPGLDKVAVITTEQLFNVGSSKITPGNWRVLALRIKKAFSERPEVSGIVITHGTDTMEETAYFLHLTVPGKKPVVITGAMRPSNAISAEGSANLYNSIKLAVSDKAKGRGVMVLMNDEIHAAREVTKTNTTRLNAFQSPLIGALGYVDGGSISFLRETVHKKYDRFEINTEAILPKVNIIYTYAGAEGQQIKSAFENDVKGLVIATVGNGNVSRGQEEALRDVLKGNIKVVFSSRTNGGRVSGTTGRYLTRNAAHGNHVISAGDLNPQKARILLMLALNKTEDIEEIVEIFKKY